MPFILNKKTCMYMDRLTDRFIKAYSFPCKLPINNSMPIPLMTENRKTSISGIISAILLTIDKIKRAIALLIIKNLNPDGLTKESPI